MPARQIDRSNREHLESSKELNKGNDIFSKKKNTRATTHRRSSISVQLQEFVLQNGEGHRAEKAGLSASRRAKRRRRRKGTQRVTPMYMDTKPLVSLLMYARLSGRVLTAKLFSLSL